MVTPLPVAQQLTSQRLFVVQPLPTLMFSVKPGGLQGATAGENVVHSAIPARPPRMAVDDAS